MPKAEDPPWRCQADQEDREWQVQAPPRLSLTYLTKKTRKRKRKLRSATIVSPGDAKVLEKMLAAQN